MIDLPNPELMPVEELNVSEDCLQRLKFVGFSNVEEILIYLQNLITLPSTFNPALGNKAIDETIVALEDLGLWPPKSETS